jgi:hypothetical protein
MAFLAWIARAAVMPEYPVYVVGSDGRFFRSIHLECADDTEATEQARQLVDGHDIELWLYARKIASLGSMSPRPNEQF